MYMYIQLTCPLHFCFRFVVSGHVQIVLHNAIGPDVPYCALKTKVTPSQRLSEKPHHPWVYVNKAAASVLCAHCTCMAGLISQNFVRAIVYVKLCTGVEKHIF